jgi:hypothetical protein
VADGTSLARVSRTNASGEYVFAAIPSGTYALIVRVPGYRTYSQTNLRVETQTFLAVDVALEVGDVAETVTVASEASPVSTTNASVSALVDRAMLASLPSAGRNVFHTATMTPTVVPRDVFRRTATTSMVPGRPHPAIRSRRPQRQDVGLEGLGD